MTCCTPRLCGCPIKINDTSVKDPIVVEPPPPVDMCVTYVFDPATELTVGVFVPCNELPSEERCVTYVFDTATELMVEVGVPCNELPSEEMCVTYGFNPTTGLMERVVVPCDELP